MSADTSSRVFFAISVEDVQVLAKEKLGRELTDEEIDSVQNMFEHGCDWAEILNIALDEIEARP